jgi:tRNA U34 5-methylaminomethyl-2-thiouridine-forming methyltransferase MnmC
MSNISKFTHIFAVTLFAITTLNCSDNDTENLSQIPLETNTSQNLQYADTSSQKEIRQILEKRFKTERDKLKKNLKQAKKEKKEAKSSPLIYYAVKTLPFACYAIAPYIPTIASIPILIQTFNKLSQVSNKNSHPNSNDKGIDLTSHLLCQAIAALLDMYVEKNAAHEEFHKGRVKAFRDNLEEQKKNKNNNI